MLFRSLFFLLAFNIIHYATCQRVAVAHLRDGAINGTVTFTETDAGLRVSGRITGLPAGLYGFHVHVLGDTDTCVAAGAHFNPEGNNHAAREASVRHVGDLGNVQFVLQENNTAVADFEFVDTVIALRGSNNILGRTLVLHENQDDLGVSGVGDTLTTGNAGARVACGVIGIQSPAEPWESNAAAYLSRSATIFISGFALFFSLFWKVLPTEL